MASPANRYTADARNIMVTSIGPSMSSAMISSAGERNSSSIFYVTLVLAGSFISVCGWGLLFLDTLKKYTQLSNQEGVWYIPEEAQGCSF